MDDKNLTPDDVAWARELAATMVTAALSVASEDDDSAKAVYETARSAALAVKTDDGMGADRWLAAMFFIAAHTASMLRSAAAAQASTPQMVWQRHLLTKQHRQS